MYSTQPDRDSFPKNPTLHSSSSDPNNFAALQQRVNNASSERPPPISERSETNDESNEYNTRGERKASGVGTLPPAFAERGRLVDGRR